MYQCDVMLHCLWSSQTEVSTILLCHVQVLGLGCHKATADDPGFTWGNVFAANGNRSIPDIWHSCYRHNSRLGMTMWILRTCLAIWNYQKNAMVKLLVFSKQCSMPFLFIMWKSNSLSMSKSLTMQSHLFISAMQIFQRLLQCRSKRWISWCSKITAHRKLHKLSFSKNSIEWEYEKWKIMHCLLSQILHGIFWPERLLKKILYTFFWNIMMTKEVNFKKSMPVFSPQLYFSFGTRHLKIFHHWIDQILYPYLSGHSLNQKLTAFSNVSGSWRFLKLLLLN